LKANVIGIIVILIAVILSLFSPSSEMGGESWNYWFFARVLSEGGGFAITDRSPLYILYLNLFVWMGYPYSVILEYIVSTSSVSIILFVLLRRYMNISLAVFAAVIWLTFISSVEPPVQKLALGASCLAIIIRRDNKTRFSISMSYAFLLCSWMFRITYSLLFFMFIFYDILRILTKDNAKSLVLKLRPRMSDWPIGFVMILIICFMSFQSPHHWNNARGNSLTWSPDDGTSLSNAAIIQDYNISYIGKKYKSYLGKDFYFTNHDAFNGAETKLDVFKSAPVFTIKKIFGNIVKLPLVVSRLTLVPERLFTLFHGHMFTKLIYYILLLSGGVVVVYASIRATNDNTMIILLLGSCFVVAATALSWPKARYSVPIIPVLVFGGLWLGESVKQQILRVDRNVIFKWSFLLGIFSSIILTICYVLTTTNIHLKMAIAVLLFISIIFLFIGIAGIFTNEDISNRYKKIIANMIIPLAILLLSNGLVLWSGIVTNIYDQLKEHDFRVLENKNLSMKQSYNSINQKIEECKGVLSLEHGFVGAFMDIPIKNVYDVFEIPPFGEYGNYNDVTDLGSGSFFKRVWSEEEKYWLKVPITDKVYYGGLTPDRIDCVLVSKNLEEGVGYGTNSQIRYDNYIKPYIRYLKSIGAKEYEILHYGKAIIYKNNHIDRRFMNID
jgi:hypothetical protein